MFWAYLSYIARLSLEKERKKERKKEINERKI
jgi:hypothetical protein